MQYPLNNLSFVFSCPSDLFAEREPDRFSLCAPCCATGVQKSACIARNESVTIHGGVIMAEWLWMMSSGKRMQKNLTHAFSVLEPETGSGTV